MGNDAERLRMATRWTVEVLMAPWPSQKRVWRPLGKPHRTVSKARAMALISLEDVKVGASRIVQTYMKKGVPLKVRYQ